MNAHFNLHRFDEFSLNIYYYSILKKTCQPYKNAHRKVFPKWFTFQWVFFNLNSRNGPIVRVLLYMDLRISLYILILSRARARGHHIVSA